MSCIASATVACLGLASCILLQPSVLDGSAASASQQAPTPRSVWDGVYTAEQATRGASVYAARCGSCHGSSMEGGEMAPALSGPTFLGNWDGLTVGDLVDRTRSTMPLDDPGSLSRAAVLDVTAEMLRANRFPAGQVPLEARPEVLGQIRLHAYKP
jgi:mono/diheme cytochrome c family protein